MKQARQALLSLLIVGIELAGCGSIAGEKVALRSGGGGAHVPLPTPGTPKEVQTLVADSVHIRDLNANVAAELANQDGLNARYFYHGNCALITGCAYGDTSSQTVVVLFGDSHAVMWMPGMVPAVKKLGVKLILLSKNSCPIAELLDPVYLRGSPGIDCAAWRMASIAAIQALSPRLVVLSERTARVVTGQRNAPYTKAQWEAGLDATIEQLQTRATRVAVMEDITAYATFWPNQCLAAFPHDVQACSVPNPNPQTPGQQRAELTSAHATGAVFVATNKWFCTARCVPVVGNLLTQYDWNHVSAPYATFLSGVLERTIQKLLK